MKPEQWIIEGEVGVSSRTLWAVMMGLVDKPTQCGDKYDTPQDPDDFSRCVKLIIFFPEWRKRLSEVPKLFPKWTPYIREWDKLELMYFKWVVALEAHGKLLQEYYQKKPHTKKPVFQNPMYDFMQELNKEAMILDGWVQDSPNSWHRPDETEQTLKIQNAQITIRST